MRENYREILSLEVEITILTGRLNTLKKQLLEMKSRYNKNNKSHNIFDESTDFKARNVFLNKNKIE